MAMIPTRIDTIPNYVVEDLSCLVLCKQDTCDQYQMYTQVNTHTQTHMYVSGHEHLV